MDPIKRNDTGAAVEDIQQRLTSLGLIDASAVNGVYGDATANAIARFRAQSGLPEGDTVDEKTWSALVDATFHMGDRTLYLRMPYFHGSDVLEVQQSLGALGFSCGKEDGIFGAYTEDGVRNFQQNMGLPSDGIVGAFTFAAIRNLHHSWEGKKPIQSQVNLGFARAADVLEQHAMCLFGIHEFTRSVASRMSNLALATNPSSRIVSADTLLVAPDEGMLLIHIALPEEYESARKGGYPCVNYEPEESLTLRLSQAIGAARSATPERCMVVLPGTVWYAAGQERSAQHFAITLLDAFCSALAMQ